MFDADIIFNGVIDGDVTINSSELVIIKKIILDKLSAEETKTYDINYDGEVNILDLIRLKKILASA